MVLEQRAEITSELRFVLRWLILMMSRAAFSRVSPEQPRNAIRLRLLLTELRESTNYLNSLSIVLRMGKVQVFIEI